MIVCSNLRSLSQKITGNGCFASIKNAKLMNFRVVTEKTAKKIEDTARRELYEETGAVKFKLELVCVYSVTGKNRVNEEGNETFGKLFFAEIESFEHELHSEIEYIEFFDEFPKEWTYPEIQPCLIEEFLRRKNGI